MGDGSQYWVIYSVGEMVGGIFEMLHPAFEGIPEHWFTHIAVDDLEKRIALVRDNGGTITREPFQVPGVGTLAVLQAASGSYCAFIQHEQVTGAA
jgi:predicted enzyme related to lactoylglutathione lyase